MKSSIMAMLSIIGVLLILYSIYYWTKKMGGISFSNVVLILTMCFNFLVILIMLYTIWASNNSLQENTNKQIETFKNEINKQIDSYQQSSNKNILAIEDSTQNHIKALYELDKKTKNVLLMALIRECEVNLQIVNEIISREEIYTGKVEKKGEDFQVPMNQFSFEAFQANLMNGTLDDPDLIDGIVRVYAALKLYQRIIDVVSVYDDHRAINRVLGLNKCITLMKKNVGVQTQLIAFIKDYRKARYGELNEN